MVHCATMPRKEAEMVARYANLLGGLLVELVVGSSGEPLLEFIKGIGGDY